MKKMFIYTAIITMLAIVFAQAAAPTYGTTDAVYEYGGKDYTIAYSAFDTLVGVDSTTLVSNRVFNPDWQYILVRDAITGTGSDSVKIEVRCDALDSDGNVLYTVAVDSLTSSAGEAIFLPVFGTVIGSKVRIKLIGYTGNGGQVILNGFHIYKRRPVVINKQWR